YFQALQRVLETRVPPPDTDEFLNEWEEHEEADFDPLESPRELLGSCLSIIVCDRYLPLYLRRLTSFSEPLLRGVCGLCHQLLLVRRPGVFPAKFLQQLSVSPNLLSPLWSTVQSVTMEGFSGSVPGLQFLSRGGQLPSREGRALVERLGTFSTLLSLYLSTLHDAEFYGETSTGGHLPFSRGQLVEMVAVLRDVYVSLHMEKHLPHSLFRAPARLVEMKPSPVEYQQLKQCVYQLLCGLHERDSRRPFCPPRHWEMAHLSKISSIPPDLFLEADGQSKIVFGCVPEFVKTF
ncbi:Ubiquitin-protein ligase E3C, partial [Geodia barretti]